MSETATLERPRLSGTDRPIAHFRDDAREQASGETFGICGTGPLLGDDAPECVERCVVCLALEDLV